MVNKPTRGSSGKYTVKGRTYPELFGSRHQVWNGTAYKTAGELTKTDLVMNKWGRIVSRKKHATAKKEKRLQKYGYFSQKGKFGYVRRSKTRRTRGGDGEVAPAPEPAPMPVPEPAPMPVPEPAVEHPDDKEKPIPTEQEIHENLASEESSPAPASEPASAPTGGRRRRRH